MKILKRLGSPTKSIFRNKVSSVSVPVASSKLAIESLEAEDQTIASEDQSERGSLACSKSKKKHHQNHVHFCEEQNVSYEWSTEADPAEDYDVSSRWYPKAQLNQFQQEAQEAASSIANCEMNNREPSWCKNLWKAYQAFCRVESAHDMDLVFGAMAHPQPLEARFVGLEIAAIPTLKNARANRRRELMVQVGRVQTYRDLKQSERARRIRKLSHEASRPSRLLAMHMAQLVQS